MWRHRTWPSRSGSKPTIVVCESIEPGAGAGSCAARRRRSGRTRHRIRRRRVGGGPTNTKEPSITGSPIAARCWPATGERGRAAASRTRTSGCAATRTPPTASRSAGRPAPTTPSSRPTWARPSASRSRPRTRQGTKTATSNADGRDHDRHRRACEQLASDDLGQRHGRRHADGEHRLVGRRPADHVLLPVAEVRHGWQRV